MTYRLSMAVDAGTCLEIECPTFDDLSQEFVSLGGDAGWLNNTAKAAVAASMHGAPVATVVRELGGEVISDEEIRPESQSPLNQDLSDELPMHERMHQEMGSPPVQEDPFADTPLPPTASDAPVQSPVAANGTQTAPPSDPWANETEAEKEWPGEAAVARTALTSNKPPPVDPWGAPSASKPAEVAPSNIKTTRDDYGREWTTGLPDAPSCNCSDPEPAVHMTAKSKSSGKKYSKWKCAKSATSGWRGKCDYDEFVN